MKRRAEALLCCLLTLPMAALAERADRDQPVHIEADRVVIEDARRLATYEGNVVLTQGTLRIAAQRVEVRQDDAGFAHGDARGNPVHFRQRMEGRSDYAEGWAERVEYDGRANVIRLTGKARLKRGEEELRGHLIVYDRASEFYRAEGGAAGAPGRVRAVILPKRDAAAQP